MPYREVHLHELLLIQFACTFVMYSLLFWCRTCSGAVNVLIFKVL